jgi:putative DNA methylase
MKTTKKLIEVALPLPEINDASAYDKMPGIGPHPKGIHQWWARLPLPTARAVLFASVVDDPSAHPEKWPTEEAQKTERERLFDIIRHMMGKKLHEHPEVYAEARSEMLEDTGGTLPVVFDPFAGGGSIPLEANRLGFEARAGDLNPIAVLLNKCNLEIAPHWAGRAPVNPEDRKRIGGKDPWHGMRGLAADVRYYGRIVRDRTREKIGHLYTKVQLPKEYGGGEVNVIAWNWTRTVASPDPAARGTHVPLVSTFWLSSKKGNEAWLEPVVDKSKGSWGFEVRTGEPKDRAAVKAGTKNGKGGFACLLTGAPIPFDYIRDEGIAGRLGFAMLALVAELPRSRIYLPARTLDRHVAEQAAPSGYPDTDLPEEALGFRVQNYGIRKHWQMFTPRQLTAMVSLSDLVQAIGEDVRRDAQPAGLAAEADAYARTVTTFLALAVDRCADFNNALCRWSPSNQKVMNLFGRQAIPMVWDFAEANILADSVGGWSTCSEYVAECIEVLTAGGDLAGVGHQIDAATGADGLNNLLVSTDPPYYDNIGYAALSDFFYVWLRRTIGDLYPDLFSTVLVPKIPELTAAPERFGGDKQKAKEHFESGFRRAFTALREKMDPRFPLTVYYAFKQADEESGGEDEDIENAPGIDLTTGWETLLEALIESRFQITATWPIRASQAWRMRAMGSNALASYIVLACRPRLEDAPQVDRRSLAAELKRELPAAFRHLQQGNIAPVDFAQAAIGPGMAIYSRYRQVLESSGKAMTVRTALHLINKTLTEVLSEQEDEFDADTRWAISWFEQHGFDEGDYGEAELLSKAKVTSVGGLEEAGLIRSKRGKVQLRRPNELPANWDPGTDKRLTIWEATHHLVRLYFHEQAGDEATAALLYRIGSVGEIARDLAYRLFAICENEKKKRSQEAQAYNALVLGWPEITRLAREGAKPAQQQTDLFGQE